MYEGDFADAIPFFGLVQGQPNTPLWTSYLAPYLSHNTGGTYDYSIITNVVRACPAGDANVGKWSGVWAQWSSWIGANYGNYPENGTFLTGVFVYSSVDGVKFRPPVKSTQILHPSACMTFTECTSQFIYNPLQWNFDTPSPYIDTSVGPVDSNGGTLNNGWFNACVAKIHGNKGNNVGLLDGHVEYVPFKLLWKCNNSGVPTHPFWNPLK